MFVENFAAFESSVDAAVTRPATSR